MISQAELTIAPAPDALQAARALATRLEAAGETPHVMEMVHARTGLAEIHLHHEGRSDEVVLVHAQREGLRDATARFQLTALQPVQWRLAWIDEALPADVALLFDPTQATARLVGEATSALLGAGIHHGLDLASLAEIAPRAAAILDDVFDLDLDLDAGADTLAALDALVDRVRPAPRDERLPGDEATFPQLLLYIIAAIGCEVGRRQVPGGQVGRLEDTTFTPGGTLLDAAGLPALGTPRAVLGLGRKVLERFQLGASTGMVELWSRGSEGFEGLAQQLDEALQVLVRTGLMLTVGQLEDEGNAGIPRLIRLVQGKVALGTLMSDRAPEMFASQVAQSGGEAMVLVADAYSTNPANGHKLDSLVVHAAADREVPAELLLPYLVEDGQVTFPYGLQLTRTFDHRYGPSRVAGLLLPWKGLEEVERSFADDAIGSQAGSAEAPPPSDREQLERLVKLAALAPFALFMVVNPEGAANQARTDAFTRGLFDDGNPDALHQLIGAIDIDSDGRFRKLVDDPTLIPRSLAAAGCALARHPGGEAARAALETIARDVASADGPPNETVLAHITEMLDAGEAVALDGPVPFRDEAAAALPLPPEVLDLAGHGPVAAFLFVAGADGNLDEQELGVLVSAMGDIQSPVLRALLDHHGDIGILGQFEALQDQERASHALQAMAAVFQVAPGGREAKEELLRTLVRIGEADGDFDARERKMIEALAHLFDGRPLPQRGQASWLVIGAVGVGLLGLLFVLWSVFA